MAKVTRLKKICILNGIKINELVERSQLGRSTILKIMQTGKISRGANVILCNSLGLDPNTDLSQIVEVDSELIKGQAKTFD